MSILQMSKEDLIAKVIDEHYSKDVMLEIIKQQARQIEELKNNSDLSNVSDNEIGWFNEYGDVDDYLMEELGKNGKEFPIVDKNKPSLNTIEAIKLISDR